MQTIITPKQRWLSIDIRELLRYKDLFFILAWRDIKVRYKQTAVGVVWAFFVPLITMVVFTIFFGNFAGIESNGVPYPIFVYLGLVIWTFFSQAISNASASMINNQDIVKKIYFPKLILPISTIIVSVIDFIISLIILVGLMLYYQYIPQTSTIWILPILAIITAIATAGISLFLSAVNVKYRDVRYALPFFIQILLFLTPVIYPTSIVGEQYRWLMQLNPMTGVIESARTVLFTQNPVSWESIGIAFAVSCITLVIGALYFKKTEAYFSDII